MPRAAQSVRGLRGAAVRSSAMLGLMAVLAAPAAGVGACELRLLEHRSGQLLMRLPLDPTSATLQVAFEHSVLGTTVIDTYRFTPAAVLIEESFEGEGYGLPHAAGPGERLSRQGVRQRLQLNRRIDPLIIRPLPEQRMRLVMPTHDLLLSSVSASAALELRAQDCPERQP